MSNKKSLSCWEITNCQKTSLCPAWKNPGAPCWEIACQLNDYRSNMNVCEDCLVFISKQKNATIAEQELQDILERREDCVLASGCPQLTEKCLV